MLRYMKSSSFQLADVLLQVIHIMYFMDTEDACCARKRIIDLLESAVSDGMPAEVLEFVNSLMDGYICELKSLQELAKLVIWKAVKRRVPDLRLVHMPKAFFEGIADLFNLDI